MDGPSYKGTQATMVGNRCLRLEMEMFCIVHLKGLILKNNNSAFENGLNTYRAKASSVVSKLPTDKPTW